MDKNIEIAVMTPAEDAEAMMDETFAASAPKGKFSKAVMNRLVDAYKDLQKLMGFPEEALYAPFEEDVTEWPADFVRGLAMVASAAEDFGQPDIIDLSDIRDDAGVVSLINALKALAADEAFADFLQSPVEGEEMESEEEPETPGDDMDSMFMSRS